MSDLGGFLDVKATTRKKGSSATVGGNTPEGEIYIRADGKKVRRVKKSKSKLPVEADGIEASKAAPKINRNTSSGSLPTVDAATAFAAGSTAKKSLNNFLGSNAPDPGYGKNGSATVSGDRPSHDGEVYIRADGKKVRRVKKATRTSSGSLDHLVKKYDSKKDDVKRDGAPPEKSLVTSEEKKGFGMVP